MKPEQIEKYKTIKEVVTPIHPVKEAGAIVRFEVWDIQGLLKEHEQSLLSHLETEGMELTDEEIKRFCESHRVFGGWHIPTVKLLIAAQLSKLSPHLARVKELEGENERLKELLEYFRPKVDACELPISSLTSEHLEECSLADCKNYKYCLGVYKAEQALQK